MRPAARIALAFFLAAPLALPAQAAEPDAPVALIDRGDTIRIAVQERLSAKFSETNEAKKDDRGALVEYYALPENKLLWVDKKGLNERAKAVIREIEAAADDGLPLDQEDIEAGAAEIGLQHEGVVPAAQDDAVVDLTHRPLRGAADTPPRSTRCR